jgi:hypothetical protein
MKNKMKIMAGVAAALIGFSAAVQAVPVLTLSDGTHTVTGTLSGSSDVYVGSVGNWTVNVATGLSIGTAAQPVIDLNDTSLWGGGSGNVLTITWTVDALGPFAGAYLEAIGGTENGTSDAFSVLLNGVLVSGSVQSYTGTPFSGTSAGSLVAGGSGNTITLQAILTASGGAGSQTSFDDHLNVPDGGATVMLLGAALSAVGLLRRKLTA